MEGKIKVLTGEDVGEGMYIAHVDDDYPLDSIVPSDHYAAEDQDWLEVVKVEGPVDVRRMLLQMYDGSREWERLQAVATVWVLVDEEGFPKFAPKRRDADGFAV